MPFGKVKNKLGDLHLMGSAEDFETKTAASQWATGAAKRHMTGEQTARIQVMKTPPGLRIVDRVIKPKPIKRSKNR
jgi:hypothetical protein